MSKKFSVFLQPEEVIIEGDRVKVMLAPGANGTIEFHVDQLKPVRDRSDQTIVRGYRVRNSGVISRMQAARTQLRMA